MTIKHDGKEHVADAKTPTEKVVEFQHSRLKVDDIHERENHYGDMVWVVDGCIGRNAINFAKYARHPTGFAAFSLFLESRDFYDFPPIYEPALWTVFWFSRSVLFEIWSQAAKPVFLDFGKMGFWRLYSFDKVRGEKICKVVKVHPESFVTWLGGDIYASTRVSEISFEETEDYALGRRM